MRLLNQLVFLFVGNICKWIYYEGKKSMKEVEKEDNGILGFIVVAFLFFFWYSF